jgi:hypothetical protein
MYAQENDGTDILLPIGGKGEDLDIKRAWGSMNVKLPSLAK